MNKMNNIIAQRVEAFRHYMRANGLSAFVVVSSDSHSSEYVADHWKSREWISGFGGSAGTAVITMDNSMLWTDSRYWLAAEDTLAGTGFKLMKDGLPDTPSIVEWLCENLESGAVVGIDGKVCSIAETTAWRNALSSCGIVLDISKDPFEELWKDRPSVPLGKARIMPLDIVGESAANKIVRLRDALKAERADGMLITMLDEIAWITNLRGTDVEYNPVLVSYMLVTHDSAVLYIDSRKLTHNVCEYLLSQGITTDDYDAVWQAVANYDKATLLMQPTKCNAALGYMLGKDKAVYRDLPVASMKAVKNQTEIAGFKKAMLSEGVAMVKLLHWLDKAIEKGGVTELDVDRVLTAFRAEDENFCGLSFSTISAYGKNAAIVHYEPSENSNATLLPHGMLLLDCGGQYLCGTTDITRTVPLGVVTLEEKEDYTRVLRGHISLAMAKFPKGTCGTQLDVLARQWLWQAGENYLHGTGHGVGHFLNVHEGPHQIRMNNVPAPLLPGMTVTNEPGLYKAGRFGIRIENTMLVVQDKSTEFGDFCSFEPLTVCPIDKRAILPELLGVDAIEYLNEYHAHVFEQLSPFFEGELYEYLKGLCAPL